MNDAPAKPEGGKPDAGRSVRSPSYPIMSLGEAIEAVRKIEVEYRSAPADRGEAAKLIGYAAGSGPANKALADLAAYGLVERAGKGELRVTPRARAILYPDSEGERREHLRAAAFEPDLFTELREKFVGLESPPEGGVATYLHRIGFNANSIRPAVKAYLGTLAFLKQAAASESNSISPKPAAESVQSDDGRPTYGGAKVGDLIQWESGGVLQFETPRRVRFVTDDGEWVAVEGSETGLPMSEVIVETPAAAASRAPAPKFPIEASPAAAVKAEPGEAEWIRNKVGPDTSVRILTSGEMGAKEIGKLIKLLEAQKMVLEDE